MITNECPNKHTLVISFLGGCQLVGYHFFLGDDWVARFWKILAVASYLRCRGNVSWLWTAGTIFDLTLLHHRTRKPSLTVTQSCWKGCRDLEDRFILRREFLVLDVSYKCVEYTSTRCYNIQMKRYKIQTSIWIGQIKGQYNHDHNELVWQQVEHNPTLPYIPPEHFAPTLNFQWFL